MNVLEKTSIDSQPLLVNLQQTVATKLTETTNRIVQDVIKIIISSRHMSPQDFVENQITQRQAPLSQIDERTNKFFQKMMKAINEELDKVPTLSQSFMVLASFMQDQQIRKKLVEGVALPSIKELITDLDNIKTSIIDDIINS